MRATKNVTDPGKHWKIRFQDYVDQGGDIDKLRNQVYGQISGRGFK